MNPNQRAFEKDTILASTMEALCKKHGIRAVVETGTEYGGTANAFAKWVSWVWTCDVELKVEEGDLSPRVSVAIGDSRALLPHMISAASTLQPLLFFLDAHTSNPHDVCPLVEELWAIKRAVLSQQIKPPVIVIHDCKVPNHPELGFDDSATGPISWDMVKDVVPEIYPDGFKVRYNDKAEGAKRGVMIIEPKV